MPVKYSVPIPTEHAEQTLLFRWARFASTKYPILDLMFAIPNGELRAYSVAARLKEEGVKPGVPDVFLPYPCDGYGGLFIEMKRVKNGRVSPQQQEYIQALRKAGYAVSVCKGFEEAKDVILAYINKQVRKENNNG